MHSEKPMLDEDFSLAYILENEVDLIITVNGLNCRFMSSIFFWPKQEDLYSCHYGYSTRLVEGYCHLK